MSRAFQIWSFSRYVIFLLYFEFYLTLGITHIHATVNRTTSKFILKSYADSWSSTLWWRQNVLKLFSWWNRWSSHLSWIHRSLSSPTDASNFVICCRSSFSIFSRTTTLLINIILVSFVILLVWVYNFDKTKGSVGLTFDFIFIIFSDLNLIVLVN